MVNKMFQTTVWTLLILMLHHIGESAVIEPVNHFCFIFKFFKPILNELSQLQLCPDPNTDRDYEKKVCRLKKGGGVAVHFDSVIKVIIRKSRFISHLILGQSF